MKSCDKGSEMGQERAVRVGIVKAGELRVVFHSVYESNGKPFVGEHTFTSAEGEPLFVPASSSSEASFTLKDVVIGIGFHWERKEEQTFRGALQLMVEDGMVRAVNVLPIDTYLTSVISSEMSAHASLELLKAHAVISRSWLLAMMERAEKKERRAALHEYLNEDSIIRWYDSDAHDRFDVCADDHCQRYQGITRQLNPHVAQAVRETHGQVLTYQGKICDARFSKCCGGMTELFENCWEPVHHPYLVAKPCPYCDTSDSRVLSQVLNNYDQETADFYLWHVKYTTEELSELVKRKSGIDFGQILDLKPVQRGPSNRIILLRIVGEKRTVTVGKELEIRKWLSETHLYSSAFGVEKFNGGFMLHGTGWGHGVGLCQIGAAVMGDKGIPYTDILQFYYPHAELTRYW